jgi:hypothetical protein
MANTATLQVLLFIAGAVALAQSPRTLTPTATGWTFGQGSTATLLVDGRVLLVGGPNASLYDPKTSTFTATTRTYSSTFQSATLLPDGRVLIAGGAIYPTANPFLFPPTAEWEMFDPATGAFAASGFMSFAKACPSAVQLNNGKC